MSGDVLFLYVEPQSIERNEAYEVFSAACQSCHEIDILPMPMQSPRGCQNYRCGGPALSRRAAVSLWPSAVATRVANAAVLWQAKWSLGGRACWCRLDERVAPAGTRIEPHPLARKLA